MDAIKVTLCPACGGCPAVEMTDEAVTIGEAENTVKLTHAEWNDLVARVRSGELGGDLTYRSGARPLADPRRLGKV